MNNYAVTLSVGDGCLKTFFAELPGLRIILLEDVYVVKSKSPEGMPSLSTLLDRVLPSQASQVGLSQLDILNST